MSDLKIVNKYIKQRLGDVDERIKNRMKDDISKKMSNDPTILGSLRKLKKSVGIYTSLLHSTLAHMAGDAQYKMPKLDPLHHMALTIALFGQDYMEEYLESDLSSVDRAKKLACVFTSDTWKAYRPVAECVRKYMPQYGMADMSVQEFLQASDPANLDVLAFVESTKLYRLFYLADDTLNPTSEYRFPCEIEDKKFYEVLTGVFNHYLKPAYLSDLLDMVKWMLLYNGYSCKMLTYFPVEYDATDILYSPVLRFIDPQE